MKHVTSRRSSLQAALAAVIGATVTIAALAGSAPAPPDRMDGVGVSAARAREILGSYPLRTLGGETVSLSALQGDVVVINFWASWCNPCRKELPRLDALNGEISKKGGRVLAIAIDDERRNVDRFVLMHALRLPVVHDGPNGLARALDLRHVPLTIVLDRSGEVAFMTSQSDDAALAALAVRTRQLMAGTASASTIHEGEKP